MSDLDAWAQKQGFDLNAHLEKIREEGVRGVARQIEADHERRMRKLDREIAKHPVEITSDQIPAGTQDIPPYGSQTQPAASAGARRDRHLRYDDSRRRGLASECVCGKPRCTLWYGP